MGDSETSAGEGKQRTRRPRRKRGPVNNHDYRNDMYNIDTTAHTIANRNVLSSQDHLGGSRTSLNNNNDNVSPDPPPYNSKSDRRRTHANRRLTKMSNTSEEVDRCDRSSRPKRRTKSSHNVHRSQSEEVLTTRERSERSKTRKKKTTGRGEEPALDMEGRPGEQRKKRRSRQRYTSDHDEDYQGDEEFSEVFPLDKEDILHPSELTVGGAKNLPSRTHMIPSQKTDHVYIQKKGGHGFANEHKSKLATVAEKTVPQIEMREKGENTLEFILQLQLRFRDFSFIIHGILAGLAMSQCIFVFSLGNESDKTLLENYHKLALGYQSIYYFCLAISVVAIYDRYVSINAGWNQFFSILCRKPSRAVALLSYVFALIFSVSMAHLDDRISVYKKTSPTLWSSHTTHKHLGTWKVLNVLRVIGAILGWITVALTANDDETAQIIEEKIKKERLDAFKIGKGRCSTSVITINS